MSDIVERLREIEVGLRLLLAVHKTMGPGSTGTADPYSADKEVWTFTRDIKPLDGGRGGN
jgi:predicted lipid-binding transport protein (Tim44 family)